MPRRVAAALSVALTIKKIFMPKSKETNRSTEKRTSKPEVRVKAPVVDRLVFVLPWNVTPGIAASIPEDVAERIKEEVTAGTVSYWRKKSGRYRMHVCPTLPDNARALLSFGATQATQKGGLRVDITPSKMSKDAIERLHQVLEQILDVEDYKGLLAKATVNRLDVAVDVVNARLDSLLVGYKGVHELTVFGKRFVRGQAETFNFGSVTSPYREAVYDKGIQLTHELVQKLREAGDNEGMKDNLVRQVRDVRGGPPTVRLEVRGIKLGGVRLHQLKERDAQRFHRFVLADLSAIDDLTPFIKANFMALVREIGLMRAVAVYTDCGDKKARKVIQALVDTPPTWWEPDDLWGRGIKALKGAGIFPKKAFKHP